MGKSHNIKQDDMVKEKNKYIAMYNKCLAKNNGDIVSTLQELSESTIIPCVFRKGFKDYTDFIDAVKIDKETYIKSGCFPWRAEQIFE